MPAHIYIHMHTTYMHTGNIYKHIHILMHVWLKIYNFSTSVISKFLYFWYFWNIEIPEVQKYGNSGNNEVLDYRNPEN